MRRQGLRERAALGALQVVPVPVDVLRQERVGPAFVDYLLETFPDVVEAESQYVN